jgi:hypothetical protein
VQIKQKLVVSGVEVNPNADRVFLSSDAKHMRPASDIGEAFVRMSVVVKDPNARFKEGDDVTLTVETADEPKAPAEDVKSTPGAPDVDAMSEASTEQVHEQPDPTLYPADAEKAPEATELAPEPTEPEPGSKVEDPNQSTTAEAPAMTNG